MGGKGQIEPRWTKGESGNPVGRPKGARNRSTIIKELLAQGDNELKMHMAQLLKAIEKSDTNAYKAILDSAYGAPVQQIEQTEIKVNLPEWIDDEESES